MKTGFFRGDVIALQRNARLPLSDLHLKHHHTLIPERHFRDRKVELPKARKALVVEIDRLVAPRKEPLPPMA